MKLELLARVIWAIFSLYGIGLSAHVQNDQFANGKQGNAIDISPITVTGTSLMIMSNGKCISGFTEDGNTCRVNLFIYDAPKVQCKEISTDQGDVQQWLCYYIETTQPEVYTQMGEITDRVFREDLPFCAPENMIPGFYCE